MSAFTGMSASHNGYNGLRIGHANVFHLYNKMHDICLLLNESPPIHILGLSETRLDARFLDKDLSIPSYSFIRRDSQGQGETGLGVYIHDSISTFTSRRKDLEPGNVECMWLQVKHSKAAPLLVGYLYRNPASTFLWYDNFVQMMDKVCENNPNVILLGDFNIDMFKQQPAWNSTVTLFGLQQLITNATRITQTSSTLLDHIYTNNTDKVHNITISNKSISDHCPIICTWSCKLPKQPNKGHTTIQYRSFKNFNKTLFLQDLSQSPFFEVFNFSDPAEALAFWYDTFLPIVNKHAPLRRKRVKHQTLPNWLSQDIIEAMAIRDRLKAEKKMMSIENSET